MTKSAAPGLTRIALATGVELDVQVAGDPGRPAVILLHGFPESHRTWRGIVPDLARDHFVLAPDQRGYARSSKPVGVANYTVDRLVADLLALADHAGVDRFTLVGHDWGGAIAWAAALQRPDRVERLVIVNAPHPLVFQRSLFDDREQRRASQYITRFRDPTIDAGLTGDLEHFLARSFADHVEGGIAEEDKAAYLDEWSQAGAITAMLSWYRASPIVVPAMGGPEPPRPAFLAAPFPPVRQETLVIWGTRDTALLPVQLADLPAHVPRLTIEAIDAGHFVPWQAPDAVVAAMRRWGI